MISLANAVQDLTNPAPAFSAQDWAGGLSEDEIITATDKSKHNTGASEDTLLIEWPGEPKCSTFSLIDEIGPLSILIS